MKTEMLGLAITTELPLVVVNSQRAGPSTGMPTKAEQSDLFQAVHGRNADAPLVVIASRSPSDCFEVAVIPFTVEHTNLGRAAVGDLVNLECDVLAKYLRRFLEAARGPASGGLLGVNDHV